MVFSSLTLETGALFLSLFFYTFLRFMLLLSLPVIAGFGAVASLFFRCLSEDPESLERKFSVIAAWVFFFRTSSTQLINLYVPK